MWLHVVTDVDALDFSAVVDIDLDSDTYGEIVNRIEVPNRGDGDLRECRVSIPSWVFGSLRQGIIYRP